MEKCDSANAAATATRRRCLCQSTPRLASMPYLWVDLDAGLPPSRAQPSQRIYARSRSVPRCLSYIQWPCQGGVEARGAEQGWLLGMRQWTRMTRSCLTLPHHQGNAPHVLLLLSGWGSPIGASAAVRPCGRGQHCLVMHITSSRQRQDSRYRANSLDIGGETVL
jgi:hypothetical protein